LAGLAGFLPEGASVSVYGNPLLGIPVYVSHGTQTFSPSGGGDEDDSGKFHGGLSGGSDSFPSDPDNPDYYTPDVLKEALAERQTK